MTVIPRLSQFGTFAPDPVYQAKCANSTCSAEDVFELLKFHEQKPCVDYLVEIQKHSALEEAEKPDPGPKKRTMTVLKLTEWLGLTEAGIKVFVDNE